MLTFVMKSSPTLRRSPLSLSSSTRDPTYTRLVPATRMAKTSLDACPSTFREARISASRTLVKRAPASAGAPVAPSVPPSSPRRLPRSSGRLSANVQPELPVPSLLTQHDAVVQNPRIKFKQLAEASVMAPWLPLNPFASATLRTHARNTAGSNRTPHTVHITPVLLKVLTFPLPPIRVGRPP